MKNTAEVADQTSAGPDGKTYEKASCDAAGASENADVSRLATVEAELAQMTDRWMRSEAETASFRARAKREIEDVKNYSMQKFATDVVEAADNMRRGLDSIPAVAESETPIVAKLREGFLGVEKSFLALLERNGIVKEDPVGGAFDPKRHEAMAEAVSDTQSPGTVLQALSSAWTLNGRLLRPAMVIVAKASAAPPPEDTWK